MSRGSDRQPFGGDAGRGAVLLCMSNGAFGGIHGKLLAALQAKK